MRRSTQTTTSENLSAFIQQATSSFLHLPSCRKMLKELQEREAHKHHQQLPHIHHFPIYNQQQNEQKVTLSSPSEQKLDCFRIPLKEGLQEYAFITQPYFVVPNLNPSTFVFEHTEAKFLGVQLQNDFNTTASIVLSNQTLELTQIQDQQQFPPNSPTSAQLLLIRHGFSMYNYVTTHFEKQTGMTFKDKATLELFQQNPALVDCELHGYGVAQTREAAPGIRHVAVHTVFVSPLRRTLQTCYWLFKDHPNKENIRFVALPLVGEIVGKVCDIALSVEDLEKEFANKDGVKVDFSELKKKNKPSAKQSEDEHWQVAHLTEETLKTTLKEKLSSSSEEERWRVINGQINQVFPKPLESYSGVYERGQLAKTYIRDYVKSQNLTPEQKIVVISHQGFLRNFTAGQPDDGSARVEKKGLKMKNCEVVPFELEL